MDNVIYYKKQKQKIKPKKNDTDEFTDITDQKQETLLIYLWIYACTRQERV